MDKKKALNLFFEPCLGHCWVPVWCCWVQKLGRCRRFRAEGTREGNTGAMLPVPSQPLRVHPGASLGLLSQNRWRSSDGFQRQMPASRQESRSG